LQSKWLDADLVFNIGNFYNYCIYAAILVNILFVIRAFINSFVLKYKKIKKNWNIKQKVKEYKHKIEELAELTLENNRREYWFRVLKVKKDKAEIKMKQKLD